MASEETALLTKVGPGGVLLDDIYDDGVKHMTYGRRLARYLSQFEWYNPHIKSTDPDRPSLDVAWAYFEHVALSRHFAAGGDSGDRFEKAEPGENVDKTILYPIYKTHDADLADFGIAVGVYFFTLKALALILFVASMINIPNLIHYSSHAYNSGNRAFTGLSKYSLQSSAICTDTTWAPCPTCTIGDWAGFPSTLTRFAQAEGPDGSTLGFILLNNCRVTRLVAVCSYASLVFMCVAIFILQYYSKNREQAFDDASQTTTDYAVEVENPPVDARDAEEWKAFFEQWGSVVSMTIVLDNEELTSMLVKRRQKVMALEDLQPTNVRVDPRNLAPAVETARPLTCFEKFLCSSDAATIKRKVEEIDYLIESRFAKKKYNVSEVFVIFETEDSKHTCLNDLSVTGYNLARNNTKALPANRIFRGKHLLSVMEPPEPSSVRWNDLDETFVAKMFQRTVTSLLTLLFITISCILVVFVRESHGAFYSALAISLCTSAAPYVCKYINLFESHENEGAWQASLYIKIAVSLLAVSTILTDFATPFTEHLELSSSSLIPSMYAIFITEMLKEPLIELSDIFGNLKRHYLGPRAADQRRMNLYFSGTVYPISWLYTHMTEVMFMAAYYSFIFPAGFLFATATLVVHYWVHKFCFLRTWARAALLDDKIAKMSREYFFSFSLAAFAIMASYNYAAFPYDNSCVVDDTATSDYVGSFNATLANGTAVAFDVPDDTKTYKYCNQNMIMYTFPAISSNQPAGSKWFGPEQAFTTVYGWTTVGVAVFVIILLLRVVRTKVTRFFCKPRSFGKPRPSINFSEVKDIFGYVPQEMISGALFPTLLCDVSNIDPELIGWSDPDDPKKDVHNAIYDVPGLLAEADDDKVFSIVMDWGLTYSEVVKPLPKDPPQAPEPEKAAPPAPAKVAPLVTEREIEEELVVAVEEDSEMIVEEVDAIVTEEIMPSGEIKAEFS